MFEETTRPRSLRSSLSPVHLRVQRQPTSAVLPPGHIGFPARDLGSLALGQEPGPRTIDKNAAPPPMRMTHLSVSPSAAAAATPPSADLPLRLRLSTGADTAQLLLSCGSPPPLCVFLLRLLW